MGARVRALCVCCCILGDCANAQLYLAAFAASEPRSFSNVQCTCDTQVHCKAAYVCICRLVCMYVRCLAVASGVHTMPQASFLLGVRATVDCRMIAADICQMLARIRLPRLLLYLDDVRHG